MKNFKILLTLTIVLLAMLPLASAADVVSSHGVTLTGPSSTSSSLGAVWQSNVTGTIIAVNRTNGVAATRAMIKNLAGATLATSTTLTGNKFTFNYNIANGSYYRFEMDASGGTYNDYQNVAAGLPKIDAYGRWINGSIGGGDISNRIDNVESVTIEILDVPTVLFQGQTPTNNSLLYYPNTNFTLNTTVSKFSGIINQSHYLFNSTGSLIGQNNGTGQNYTSEFTGLSVGLYYFNATANNGTSMEFTEIRQVNVTNYNSIVNITAINAITGAAVTTFEGFVYQAETGFNKSYTTSSGQALVESRFGNVTIYINAVGYAYMSSGVNLTVAQYNKIFAIHQTNTLNITFYNQATPTTVLTGPTISLDLISDLYANNYTTTNGTLYITLLTPEDYNLRYYANGYTTRFYTVTVTNRSYQSISLYLINNTVSTNLTISVIDEITDPVNDAQVQVLKYNLPTNTYVLQEIVTTGNDGTAIATVTLNNEYYKFIVVYDGEVKLTTTPEYITSTSKTLQISTGSSFGAEFFEYYNFYKDLTFNNNTDNFRLDYVDGDGVNSQVCMRVSRESNFSSTVLDTTCQTGASGTILISVSPVNGTTYSAYAYFLDSNSVEYYLDSEYYTYPSGNNVFGSYGLFLQLILTVSFALVGLVGMEYIPISTSISLYLGQYLGLNQFSTNGLNALFVASILLFLIIIMNKRRL